MAAHRLDAVVFGLIISVSTLLVVTNGDCDPSQLAKCMEILQRDQQQSQKDQQAMFTATGQELEAFCRIPDELLSCIDAAGCSNHQSALGLVTLVNVTKRVSDYMCKQHRQEFQENVPCFKSKNLQTSMNFCKENSQAKIDGTSSCEAMNRLTSCSVRSLSECCGSRAGELFGGFVGLMQSSAPPGCQLRSDLDVEVHDLVKSKLCSGCERLMQYVGSTLFAIIVASLFRND